MNTQAFSRYLLNSLEHDIEQLSIIEQTAGHAEDIAYFRGAVYKRKETLRTACGCWKQFPETLKIEARRLIRCAESALNE